MVKSAIIEIVASYTEAVLLGATLGLLIVGFRIAFADGV